MKQTRLASTLEIVGSTASGFFISLTIQWAICTYYDLPLSALDNLGIISVFTLASLLRGYLWRRVMEAIHVRRPLSPFMSAVVAERFRQVEVEGFSAEHDDEQRTGELAVAGSCYALLRWGDRECGTRQPPKIWPWDAEWWKPQNTRRDLVRAAALIVAEGEKYDRARSREKRRTRVTLAGSERIVGRERANG